MIRPILFGAAILLACAVGAESAEARGCRGPAGYYGGGYYGGGYGPPVYRSARYYGGPSYYARGPAPVYRRAYYAAPPAYYARPRSGVTLSFGF